MEKDELNDIINKLETKSSLEKLKKGLEGLSHDDTIYAANTILSNLAKKALDGEKIKSEMIDLLRDTINDANLEMKDLATKDPLTKLHNRNQLEETFKTEISRMKRDKNYKFSILIIDIDFFKKFNDEYGHNAGDEVLKNFSRIITENIRGTDGAFRYGGEEFVVIYSGTSASEAHRAAKCLKSYMNDSKIEFIDELGESHEKIITFSGGITEINSKDTLEIAIERADKLLYKVKDFGRNNVIFE